jgi:DNA-binding beta-propeller fold protein YncE
VAEIGATTATSFSGTATDVASALLPGLNFPDDLAIDPSGYVYASNFCVGSQAGVCGSEPAGTTAAESQQTSSSAGRQDALSGCSYASGNAVFTPASGNAVLFNSCAGSGIVAACTTTAGSPLCGSADATVALTKPGGGVAPVPSGLAAIPTTTSNPSVVVADAANNTLSVVSLSGSTLSASAPTSLASGCDPADVAIGPATGASATVYVACPGTGAIEVGTVSGSGTPTLSSFTASALPTTGSSAPAPYGIAVNPSGSDLAVSDSANGDVVVYPYVSGTTLGTDSIVPVGATPDGVAIDENNVFVADEGSNNVTVVDPPSTGAVRGHIVRRHSHAARRRTVSLTPLVAPLPGTAAR